MTAAARTPEIEYLGNGVTTAFAAPFRFLAGTLVVDLIAADGTVTTQIVGSQYSVSGGDTDTGGTVTFVAAPAAAVQVRIRRVTPRAQTTEYPDGGTFPAQSHEDALDRAMLIDQEQDVSSADTAARALMVPDGESVGGTVGKASARAGRLLAFSSLAGAAPLPSSFTVAQLEALIAAVYTPAHTQMSDLVNFVQSGASAAPRSVQDELRETLKVTQFLGVLTVTAAIQAAVAELLARGGGVLEFPRGTYTLTAPITFTAHANITLRGFGAKITATTRFESYFKFSACSRVLIEGFEFDSAQPALPTYTALDYPTIYNVPVYVTGSSDNVKIRYCRFTNLYTAAIYSNDATNLDYSDNYFSSPLQAQDQFLIFVHCVTVGGNVNIMRSQFDGAVTTRNDRSPCGVGISGLVGKATVAHCRFSHCGRNNTGGHRLGVIDIYADASDVTVFDVQADNCREQFMRLSTTAFALVKKVNVTVAAQADAYSTISVESGSWPLVTNPICKRIRFQDVTILDAANRHAYAIGVNAYDWGAGPVDVEIAGCNIQGAETAFFVSGPFNGLKYLHNTVSDVKAFLNVTLKDSGGSDLVLTTTLGTQAASKLDGLRVEDNDVTIRAGSNFVPVSISGSRGVAYTGGVGDFFFNRNRVKCTGPATSIGVNVIFNAATPAGRFYAEGNVISGYTTPFQLRSMLKARVYYNSVPGMTQAISTDGTVSDIDALGNVGTDGARKGTATLVGGTKTINTTEIMAGDVVRVTRTSAGGTLGHLSVGAINPGVSFPISSSDVGDTSVVAWEIFDR